jgi:hypothetical protein
MSMYSSLLRTTLITKHEPQQPHLLKRMLAGRARDVGKLVLASTSPRRRELLALAGLGSADAGAFQVRASHFDESTTVR